MDSATHMLRTGRRGTLFEAGMAVHDLSNSIRRLGLAWSLAWHDVMSRYRGSILGPFWITLSMGFTVLGIAFLYAELFGISVRDYLPMAAFGIVFFGFISASIVDGCETFTDAAGMLSQTNLPMFTFVWRVLLRNLVNLLHHLVIVVAVLVIFGLWRNTHYAEALAGFILLVLNLGWISMLTAIAAARFRDIPQVMTSVMQFATFVTPVFWPAERLTGSRRIVLDLNPFYHLLESVRSPLLGRSVEPQTAILLVAMAALGWLVTFSLFAVTRRRIVHYL